MSKGNITYKDLYTLIRDELAKTSKSSTISSSTSVTTSSSQIDSDSLITGIQELIQYIIPGRIVSGLQVEEISGNNVVVRNGIGVAYGRLYTLASDVTLTVPLDDIHDVFYVNLYLDGITIESSQNEKKLTIAKIIVPEPGITNGVYQNKSSGGAYILMRRTLDVYINENNKFEEDTLEIFRDNLDEVLADNLVGEINLSEHLTINNAQNSIELDSKQLKLMNDGVDVAIFDRYGIEMFDDDGKNVAKLNTEGVYFYGNNNNIISKFEKDGVYFYNASGEELARFTTTSGRIGNINITTDTIESTNFVTGINGKGFKIKSDGSAEFNDMLVRGELRSAVFQQNEVNIQNGDLYITAGSILTSDIVEGATVLPVEDAVFSNGDILYLGTASQHEYVRVVSGGGTNSLTIERNIEGTSGSQYAWASSTPIALMGDRIVLVCSGDDEENVPYIEIINRTGVGLYEEATLARFGNLHGVTDSEFGELSGFGLYSDNVYLRGALYSPTIKTATAGARIELTHTNNNLVAIDENDIERVTLGDIGTDYGLQLKDASGNITLEAGTTLKQEYMLIDEIKILRRFSESVNVTGFTTSGTTKYAQSITLKNRATSGANCLMVYSEGLGVTGQKIDYSIISYYGETLTANATMFTPSEGSYYEPGISINDNNIIWSFTYSSAGTNISFTNYPIYLAMTNKSYSVTISPTSLGISGRCPRVAFDTAGNIHLVYSKWETSTLNVYYAKYDSSFNQLIAPTLIANTLTSIGDAVHDIIDNVMDAGYSTVPSGKTERIIISYCKMVSGYQRCFQTVLDLSGNTILSGTDVFSDFPSVTTMYFNNPRLSTNKYGDIDEIYWIFESIVLGNGDGYKTAKTDIDGNCLVSPHSIGGTPGIDIDSLGATFLPTGNSKLMIAHKSLGDNLNGYIEMYKEEILENKNLANLFNFVSS